MRRTTSFTVGAAFVLMALVCAATAEPLSADGGHDIGALMATAQETYDLSREDAVVLLEDRAVEFLEDGGRRTTVHRIVWIGTEFGIDTYADLRVPWNTETSRLTVTALRTWRDGRWWPHAAELSPTAIVETLPHALDDADDYTGVRETMLLHDGVEIPCIVETVYSIETDPSGLDGADGLWVFCQADPAVRVRFSLAVPGSLGEAAVLEGNGAPEAKRSLAEGAHVLSWSMEPVARLPRPIVSDAASVAPFVSWSTWALWDDLSEALLTRFDDAASLSPEMADTLEALFERSPDDWNRAELAAGFVDDYTRRVAYDHSLWSFRPRPAARTWETAYGHALDRAALAAAAFREAGCEARPVFVGSGFGPVTGRVPALSRFADVRLWVVGDDFEAVYDPAYGSLTRGRSQLAGRAVYRLGLDRSPEVLDEANEGRVELRVVAEESDDGEWSGSGWLHADGVLSPYGEMVGFGGEASHALGGFAGVIEGADLTEHNVDRLTPDEVRAGYAFSLTPAEPDDQGRTSLVIARPGGGVLDALPSDVTLYENVRTSPVLLAAPVSQKTVVHLKPASEVCHLPEPRRVDNGAGWFTLEVEEGDDGWITVTRELGIVRATLAPEEWPLLRALLLDETDAANGTILLK